MVPVARLDVEVIDALDDALLTADVVEEIVSRATALVTPAATDVDDLQGELRRIDGELARLGARKRERPSLDPSALPFSVARRRIPWDGTAGTIFWIGPLDGSSSRSS